MGFLRGAVQRKGLPVENESLVQEMRRSARGREERECWHRLIMSN